MELWDRLAKVADEVASSLAEEERLLLDEKVAIHVDGEGFPSIKVDPELWRKVRLLATERGVTPEALIRDLLESELEADALLGEEPEVNGVETLLERRKRGEVPFVIDTEKTAVELVREVRGE